MSAARTTVRRTAVGLALVLLAGTAAACGTDADDSGDTGPLPAYSAANCVWMKQSQDSTPHAVILVDDTASVRGAGVGSRGIDYTSAVTKLVRNLVKAKNTVSVGAFGGDTSTVNWIGTGLTTDPGVVSANPRNQKDLRGQAASCLTHYIQRAQDATPQAGGTDVLAALGAGADSLSDSAGPLTLVVFTDGLSTNGCADLRSAVFRSPQEIDAIAQVCAEQDELPALKGVRTTIEGVAQSADDQTQGTSVQRTWLRSLWTRLCHDGHAQSCRVTSPPIRITSPRHAASTSPADPKVGYGAGRTQTYHLPGAALFGPNSSTIRGSALPLLNQIAVNARTTAGSRVVINGYVDPRGPSDNNHRLSQRRADAVRQVLVGMGATRVEAHGRGVAAGCSTSDGALTQKQRYQCDRRVDIEIIGT